MKRLLWTIPMLFALIPVNAFADSVTYKITNTKLYISPITEAAAIWASP